MFWWMTVFWLGDSAFVFPNVELDRAVGSYHSPNEPSVAISLVDRNRIVAGANTSNVYVSEDGGKTWKGKQLKSPHGVWGDPCIVSDTEGHFFYFHLSNPVSGPWRSRSRLDRIVCQRSQDGGRTWSKGSYTGWRKPFDQDKEWATVDWRNNTLYVTWTEFDKYESRNKDNRTRIMFSRSSDRGETWSEAKVICDRDGDCRDGDNTVEGAVPAVGPNGELYVAWALAEKIYFDRSLDAGETWLAKDRVVAEQPGGWNFKVPGLGRCNGLPVLVSDHGSSPYGGSLYLNWTDQAGGWKDTDVRLICSRDGGETWSKPKRVNDDPPGRHQFMSWPAVDQTSGYLYVVFYDRRNYRDYRTDVTLAFSTDGGDSFKNVCISERPFAPRKDVFFGNYNNIAAHAGRIVPIWTRMDHRDTSIWATVIEHDALK